MLIFISNEPRTYAWGSKDAIPEILQKAPTGEPQAEVWLGDHIGDPAQVAGCYGEQLTLIDLIKQDPKIYGVSGGPLPFLVKILGIGGPLSLQVHPNISQAEAGFAEEEQLKIPLDDPRRSFKDKNHKPELLVALTPVRALFGFRPIRDLLDDLATIATHAGTCGVRGSQPLLALATRLSAKFENKVARSFDNAATNAEEAAARATRDYMLDWVFSETTEVTEALNALKNIFVGANATMIFGFSQVRFEVLQELLTKHPNDPGALVSLMTNIVQLAPGEALFVETGQLHAYLSGVGVEVMASSDNVIRAGLTPKHVDISKLRSILSLQENAAKPFLGVRSSPGVTSWEPDISDFSLHRVRVAPIEAPFELAAENVAPMVRFETPNPVVLLATEGQLWVERVGDQNVAGDSLEVARVRKGQSLYISTGDEIEISGHGEAFLATVAQK
ncbi:MAG TPA: mannose-6-phosphate isomerase, class I [Microbacteriaceae bacterium]|nr:mannose-6-phosphate isomerase, class I [Microbacteriaceae bacterium]